MQYLGIIIILSIFYNIMMNFVFIRTYGYIGGMIRYKMFQEKIRKRKGFKQENNMWQTEAAEVRYVVKRDIQELRPDWNGT